MSGLRAFVARRLRLAADRLDRPGAPKATHVRFTFEDHVGMMFRDDGRGCRLWYLGDQDYERAHTEAGPVAGANSTAWLPQRTGYGAQTYKLPEPVTGPAILEAGYDMRSGRITGVRKISDEEGQVP